MSAPDLWALAPVVTIPLPCDQHPLRWEAGVLHGDEHDDGDFVLAALLGGAPPCLRLRYVWSQIDGSIAPDVTANLLARSDHEQPPGTGSLDPFDESLLGDLAVPLVLGDDGLGDDLRWWTLRRLPPSFIALAFVSSTAARAQPERWATLSRDERTDIDLAALVLLRSAFSVPLPWSSVTIDPWSIGEVRGSALVLPPTWFASVWLAGAAVIEDEVTLRLRPTAEPDEAIARVAGAGGSERTRRLRRSAGGIGWEPV